jgi:hypothetical protein
MPTAFALRSMLLLVVSLIAWPPPAAAQDPGPPPAPESETIDVFGLDVSQSERFKISGLFVGAWTHDGMQAQLGFEKQARVAQATLAISGRVTDRIRYFVSFNPVNEVAARPACGEATFFFPNDPRIYASAGPNVPCDAERGNKRVDTYNTYALDYINQQGPLREGYVDWRVASRVSTRFGRFIEPIGFAPAEVGSWTAKDLTRIQRLNAEANFGLMFAFSSRAAGTATDADAPPPRFEAALMGMVGDGDRQKDYDYFYFADATLDTNSAVNVIASLRARPIERLDLRAAFKRGFTGSKVERLPSYWASKRNDDAAVLSARLQLLPVLSLFGEYARYVWGPTTTSAELVGVDTASIEKPGYYVGGQLEVPLGRRLRAGVTVTREELSRDDSLVKFLAAQDLYDVELGRKDRSTIARVYVTVARLLTIGVFRADVSNPYPWISGSWPVSGPRAFTGRAPDKYGLVVLVRSP